MRRTAREPARLGRRHQPLAALGGLGRQLGGALVGVGRGQVPRALREALGRRREQARHRLVGGDRGRGEMPCAPIAPRSRRGGEGGGERGVSAAALLGGGAPVGERPQQRMPEAQAVRLHGQRARALGLGERLRRQLEPRRRFQDRVGALGLARGAERQRVARRRRELPEPALEGVRDEARGRQRLTETDPARHPVVADRGGDLQRGQRVPVGRARHALDEVAAEPPLGRAADEGGDRVSREPSQRQPLEPRHTEARRDLVPEGGDHRDRVAAEAARREAERLQRGAVEPLRVVDAHQHGLVGSGRDEQAEHRREHGEALDRLVGHRERAAQGACLGRRQVADQPERRMQQLVQSRERQLGLVFDPGGAQEAHVRPHARRPLPRAPTCRPPARLSGREPHHARHERRPTPRRCGRARLGDRPALPEPTCAATPCRRELPHER